MGYGPAMTADYRPSLARSFERHLRAENRSEHTIASYLDSLRQAAAFLAARGRSLVDARRAIVSSACPRPWRTCGPRRLPRQSQPALMLLSVILMNTVAGANQAKL